MRQRKRVVDINSETGGNFGRVWVYCRAQLTVNDSLSSVSMQPVAYVLNGNSVLIRRWLRRVAHREQQQLCRHNDDWVPHH